MVGYRVLVTINKYVKRLLEERRVSPSQAIIAVSGRLYSLTRDEVIELSSLALVKPYANVGIGRFALAHILPVAERLDLEIQVVARAGLVLYLGRGRVIEEYERRGILRSR